ncbi:NAD-dependent epimerase/dehydratase family protein [Rhodococcus sp. ACT016]|uniref:NAD-dependent epimerase/dehydratase family protein n=1 Tax=Rhodococcus sp. ACT016 TaxID=3134808 RepID=UPI003D2D119E
MTDHTATEPRRTETSSAVFTHSAPESRLRSIAVIGSSGFIGSATIRALAARRCRVTAIARQRPQVPHPGVRYITADITELHSLVHALEDVDIVVHAASYTGPDERLCETINRLGTENVITAAHMHRIEHVINTSTIGVYGLGPFSNVVENAREPNPVTALSAARAAADDFVRARGGTTVRPGFVYGPGDRWFLPGLQSILGKARTWIDHGSALLSVIEIGELGALIAELALRCSADDQGALFHAAHPEPKTVHDITIRLSGRDFNAPSASCTYTEALSHAIDLGLTARQIDLVGREHSIDSSKIWDRTQRTPAGLDVRR